MRINKTRIALFGSENTVFLHAYEKELSKKFDVQVFNSNRVSNNNYRFINYYEPKDGSVFIRGKVLRKLTKHLKLQRSRIYQNFIEKRDINSTLCDKDQVSLFSSLEGFKPDIFLFFWGTNFRREIKCLKSKFLDAKFCLSVNSYPTRTLFTLDNPFIKDDIDYFNSFDSLILSSTAMEEYFKEQRFINKDTDTLVCPEYINTNKMSFLGLSQEKESLASSNNLIFLGNTNFSERSIDDVSKLLLSLADAGVSVYLQESTDTKIEHKHIYYFKPFTFEDILDGVLVKYIQTFDGVIYSYNDSNLLRSKISVTTRLLLAESTGVPVYIFGQVPLALNDGLIDIDFRPVLNASDIIHKLNLNQVCDRSLTSNVQSRVNRINDFLEKGVKVYSNECS